ncbi:nucleotidyltransferase [beta proteobacterium AAP51]|nr:nucleotidyltransferase [beta proteobacterium AAP51]
MAAPATPSSSLLAALAAEVARHAPFSQMAPEHVALFVAGCKQQYHAPGEVVLGPHSGPVQALMLVRQGSVTGRPGSAQAAQGGGTGNVEGAGEGDRDSAFELLAGDLFPVGAVLAGRAVTSTYTAQADTFSLALPLAQVQQLLALSPPFAGFLQRRVAHYIELSRQAVQKAWASQTLAAQSLEARLGSLPRKQPLACSPATPLAEALAQMHARRVGSVLVVDEALAPLGILTRHDILGRVTLPQLPLQTPLAQVMSAPVHSLDIEHTLQDAALLMTRHGIRHVPVTEGGRVVNIVSERDLFALQRLSLKQLSTQIRAAADEATLRVLAAQIRQFARHLLGQGVQARQLTELVSHLNDVLTERLVQLVAARRGLDLAQACWLAFGSEGRGEQTVATDQDNGLVFSSTQPEADRALWRAFGQEVNEALDAAGYPLCKGGIMAGQPACCLSVDEWQQRFMQWMRQGEPEDLLNASIFFDLRPLCGHTALAEELVALPAQQALHAPRFLRLMVDNALRRAAPLNWRGALATHDEDGHQWFDLKLQGTAIFVDAARLFTLAQGLPVLGTRARLEAAAPGLRVAAQEAEAWVGAFEFLQMLRLRVQLAPAAAPPDPKNANRVDVATLNDIDRRMLKEAVRVARRLQQRLEMDFLR